MAQVSFSPFLANAALPLVRRIVSDVVDQEARLAALASAYKAKKTEPDASQEALNDARRAMSEVSAQRDACVAELVDLGLTVKDAATGLVDFPGELDGGRVLFCWRLGEERVEFFHGESEGFSGRRPIPVPVSV